MIKNLLLCMFNMTLVIISKSLANNMRLLAFCHLAYFVILSKRNVRGVKLDLKKTTSKQRVTPLKNK